MKLISSRDNPAFKHITRLVGDARYRKQQRSTVIDGDHLLEACMDAGAHGLIARFAISEASVETAAVRHILERAQRVLDQVEILVFTEALFRQISPVVTPTGLLAEISEPEASPPGEGSGDVLALAGVQDAGNLGTLLRTALAAGIRDVWLDTGTAHAWSPKAMRAGMGAQFSLRLREGCQLASDLLAVSRPVLVTSLGEGCRPLYDLDLRSPVIWVFGSEGRGVPSSVEALATQRIRIPMSGPTESLNVAAACAICLFEQMRQRQA